MNINYQKSMWKFVVAFLDCLETIPCLLTYLCLKEYLRYLPILWSNSVEKLDYLSLVNKDNNKVRCWGGNQGKTKQYKLENTLQKYITKLP